MFTPPPSPLPLIRHPTTPPRVGELSDQDSYAGRSKRKSHWALRWSVVPLALILLTAFARFRTHPAVFDLFSMDGDHEWKGWTKLSIWSLHEPHGHTGSHHSVERSTSNHLVPRDSTVSTPTVPSDPVLPTPFPQPFDTTLSTNFSTTACYDFFLNMSQTNAFLACRPFSLLISASYAFSQAQNNISSMNTDVWGICHTVTSQAQCDANMSWFASSLEASCQTDLANQVATAVVTLNALRAFDLMRNVVCQVDPTTNAYCFVEAVANSDPSSYWFYQLPLGQPLGPNITTSACNSCTSELMTSYALALDSTNGSSLGGLSQTYNAAVESLNNVCGPTYAKKAQVSTPSSAWVNAEVPRTGSVVMLGLLVLFAGVLCGS